MHSNSYELDKDSCWSEFDQYTDTNRAGMQGDPYKVYI